MASKDFSYLGHFIYEIGCSYDDLYRELMVPTGIWNSCWIYYRISSVCSMRYMEPSMLFVAFSKIVRFVLIHHNLRRRHSRHHRYRFALALGSEWEAKLSILYF